jgi:hypothetical protein
VCEKLVLHSEMEFEIQFEHEGGGGRCVKRHAPGRGETPPSRPVSGRAAVPDRRSLDRPAWYGATLLRPSDAAVSVTSSSERGGVHPWS